MITALSMLAGGGIASAFGQDPLAAASAAQNEALNNCSMHECWNGVKDKLTSFGSAVASWFATPEGQLTSAMVAIAGDMGGGLGGSGGVVRSATTDALEGTAAAAGSVRAVNPTGSMQNCTNCVAVVDNLLVTGNQASALPRATPVPFDQLGTMYGTKFSGWTNQQGVEQALLAAGNGTRAVVYGTDGVAGHVWNAVVQNGRVNYIDGQIGVGGGR